VGVIVPAGARVLPEAVAMFAGTLPIVSVNDTVDDPEVMDTGLSPESAVVGAQDQLPEVSAVAETDWLPTVPVTAALAVVTPANVGVVDVTQNWVAP
jgi:hypothetical protein